jgi:glycosyltransferase involved in cell wall biosynthesis
MNIPLVSIIVPCYNQAQYLDEALQSVLDQTYSNWECIIVNDGSPDNTAIIASVWTARDPRFKYICKENSGLSSARNAGIEVAKGEFILPLDADDRIGSNYLKLATQAFKHNADLRLVYCNAEKFDVVNEFWHLKPFSLLELAIENMIFCSAIFKKKDWQLFGGYDETLIYGLEDWEFWITLLKNGGEVEKLDKVCFYYRIKDNSMMLNLNSNKENNEKQLAYISIKHADFFVSQKGSFPSLQNRIIHLEKNHYKKVTSKKKALKIFLKVFFAVNSFDSEC